MKICRIVILLTMLIFAVPSISQAAIIVVDPGHGGSDSGAVGCGLYEDSINLNVSLKLRDLLQAAGHTVYMTRTTDTFIDLAPRASYANGKNANTFASIHCNSAGVVATGIETYCYSFGASGETQARHIQTRMVSTWPLANRGVKAANFAVLRLTNMTATLSELAFINNCAKDATYLGNESRRMDAARAHCNALCAQWGGNASACNGGTTPTPTTGTIIGFSFEGALNGTKISGVSINAASKSATSDGSGLFKITAPVGSYTLTASKAGYNNATRTDCEAVKAGAQSWCSVALQKAAVEPQTGTIIGFTFEGSIGGTKIGGVNVNAASKSLTTGADGLFKITAPVGSYTLKATKAGYNNATRTDCEPVKAGADSWCSVALTLATAPDGTAKGSVANNATKAKIAASVSVSGGPSASYNGSTDWSFSLKAGSYTISASANGYDNGSVTCVVNSNASSQCPIFLNPKKATIKGNVTDAASGATIAASVSAAGQSTNYNGSGEWSFAVDAGNYTVSASATGYLAGTTACSVVPGETKTCSVKLSKATSTKGLLYGKLKDAESGDTLEGVVLISEALKYYTDSTGVWRFNLDAGNYNLTGQASGYEDKKVACSAVGGQETECVIALTPKDGTLKGKVINNTTGSAISATVTIDASGLSPIKYDGLEDWSVSLKVGTYTVKASAEGYTDGSTTCVVNPGRQSVCSVGLNPKDAVLGSMKGIVHDARSSEQLIAAKLELVNGASKDYEGKGEWVFDNLAPGTYVVKASSPGYYDGQVNCRVVISEVQYCAISLQIIDETSTPVIVEPGVDPTIEVFSGDSCSMGRIGTHSNKYPLVIVLSLLVCLLLIRRNGVMKKSRNALKALVIAVLGFGFWMVNPADVQAQDIVRRFDGTKLWKLQQSDAIPIVSSELVSTSLAYPKISPDGDKVVMVKLKEPGLYLWRAGQQTAQKVTENPEASLFVEWQNNEDFSVRVSSSPFARDSQRLFLSTLPSHSLRIAKRVLNSHSPINVYDFEDIIVLEENSTIKVISDDKVDRYYSPMLSPDRRYVVFSGLATGVQLFDIQKDAVVFVGSKGTEPCFSADSRYLVYVETLDDGQQLTKGDVVVLDLQTQRIRRVANPTNEIRYLATISSNAYLAYQTDEGKVFRVKLDL